MRILVTGASHFLGYNITLQLLSEGHTVSVLTDPDDSLEHLAKLPVTLHPCGYKQTHALVRALQGIDIVVHASCIRPRNSTLSADQLVIESTRRLLRALRMARPDLQLWLQLSSIAAHGPSDPNRPAIESLPSNPVSDYGRACLAAEALVNAAQIPSVIVRRPMLVLGSGNYDFARILRWLRFGILPDAPGRCMSVVDVRDISKAVSQIIQAHNQSDLFFIEDGLPIQQNLFLETIAKSVTSQAPRSIKIPRIAFKSAAVLNQLYTGARGKASSHINDLARDLLEPNWQCSAEKLQKSINWRPKYNWELSLPEIITNVEED